MITTESTLNRITNAIRIKDNENNVYRQVNENKLKEVNNGRMVLHPFMKCNDCEGVSNWLS